MKLVSAALLALAAACSTVTGTHPDLASSEVVPLAHQPADQIAARVCEILHTDGAHVSLIADPRSNSIVLTAPPGREVELARAVALVKELDQRVAGAKATIGERASPAGAASVAFGRTGARPLPDGAASIGLAHADAHEIARTLNELDEASYWKAQSGRGCVLYGPIEVLEIRAPTTSDSSRFLAGGWREIPADDPERIAWREDLQLQSLRHYLADGSQVRQRWNAPPPKSFRARDARTLVVLEADRDEAYLPQVRELVARLDQPEMAQPRAHR